jgi:hypothetical protein
VLSRPALLVLWVRREVPETEEWRAAKRLAIVAGPGIVDLFPGDVPRTTILTILVCSVSLSAHWAFIFWCQQHLRNLPDVIDLSPTRRNELASIANLLVCEQRAAVRARSPTPGCLEIWVSGNPVSLGEF